jgi:hypothetical protein
MDFNRSKAIEYFLAEIENGRMEFSQMRKLLAEKGVDKEEIGVVVNQVDHELQHRAQLKMIRSEGRSVYDEGVFLAAAGLAVTMGTYLGLID